MLFNSPQFLFVFLPVALVGFYLAGRFSHRLAALWVLLVSIAFYGYWDVSYVPLLLASVLLNFAFGARISVATASQQPKAAKVLLTAAISLNLMLLAYFKYGALLVNTANQLVDGNFGVPSVVLPLGISFFTFTQIAFLVDAYKGKVRDYDFVHYAVFVTYFPHLIAGPILHHKEMMPQFDKGDTYAFSAERFADGLLLFLLGLAKKVVLADRFGEFAAPSFAAASAGEPLTFFAAWGGVLCYTFQLYFDFSGYSEMAIGLARMIGVELPVNFNSPYKARSIIDFWRRWHMTLSRFLLEYLYIPLGGNRNGTFRRYLNLMVTMLLGGLWHGASWTFLIWGGLHGLYLIVNHGWRRLVERSRTLGVLFSGAWTRPFYWAITFFCVVIGWVVFKAETFDAMRVLFRGLFGFSGSALPTQVVNLFPITARIAESQGRVLYLADGTVMGFMEMTAMLVAGFIIVLFFPNLIESRRPRQLAMLIISLAFTFQRILFSQASSFLYFQF